PHPNPPAQITELSSDLRELRRQHHQLTLERDEYSSKLSDLTDQVEISLLDKEVAEERFEIADSLAEGFKERVAELEVECLVLREENERMEGKGEEELKEGGEGRSSLAFRQLEKQNERLKDALIRLRDLTHETEMENKHRIADLEKELDLTSDLQVIFDNNMVELERAEGQVEDLKQQLDDALGAEDMLEQLTERNLTLSEKIEEMLVAIEDLEALKELNDELEESHVETEKQMQDEIDLKDLLLREQQARADALEDNVADYEGTVGQFRELVMSLQGDLDQLREHQANQQTESQSLTSQSQAMLNLNLKLQSSVLKGQVKTIDLELRRLDAQQAMEHLSIVKPYLLPAFFEDDSDAVDSLLFFERLASKADLISMVIEQNHNVTDSLNNTVPEALVGICETRAKLGRFSALNKRFAAQLKRCSPEIFLKMGRVYREVVGTEKRLDSFIEMLRKEELRETECGREVDGFIAQAEHLAELHLQESHLDLAEREQSYIASLDLDFDTIAAAAGFSKQALATIAKDPDVEMELGDASLDDMLFKPLQHLLNQARSSKVVTKKLLRRLDDLVSNSSALSMEHAQGFETLAYNSSAIATASAKQPPQLASDIAAYCSDVRTSKRPFQPLAVIAIAQEVTATELGKQTPRPLEEISALLAQLSQDVATTLAAALDHDHVVKFSYDPPWVSRVAQLQSTAAVNVDAERKVVKLNEEMRDLVREMRIKDQSYQESAVKIELMEKRMEAVKKQADAISELETELLKSKKQERAYEEAIETLQGDLDTMEQEINKLKQTATVADKQGARLLAIGPDHANPLNPGTSNNNHDGEAVSYEGNMETSRLIEQIDSLRGAVRFLRSENSYLKSQDLLAELEELPTYAFTTPPVPSPPTPGKPSRSRQSSAAIDPVVQRQSFAAESKLLLREARVLSATPRLVDLSLVKPGGRMAGWQPSARAPESQYMAEKERARSLGRKVERLWAMRPVALSIGA
ncbi:dynactin 1, partial [Phenoliferia sp. Uapishka_3]